MYAPELKKVVISSLANFVDEDRDKMVFCLISAAKRYSRTEQFRPKSLDDQEEEAGVPKHYFILD